jgi:hypothetical protein
VFNDDQGDLIRNMWYNYYSYYYKDPSQKYENTPVINGSIGNLQTLQQRIWLQHSRHIQTTVVKSVTGVTLAKVIKTAMHLQAKPNKPPFFRDIKIYGFSQKKFASYVLDQSMIQRLATRYL